MPRSPVRSRHRLPATAGLALASLLAAWTFASHAQTAGVPVLAPGNLPAHVLNLSAEASTELVRDTLNVAFSTTREGTDAAAVQAALKQSLDAALNEARRVARPGQIEVQTGAFSLHPRYGRNAGITGWQGTVELLVHGKDVAGISQLAGRIQTLSIARVGYTLSRQAQEKVESEVAAQAIARFRGQAEAHARAFGYSGYSIREVAVNTGGAAQQAPMPRMAMRASAEKMADDALPIEAGKATVTASVTGSVVMHK
jgi:predicted secreted protein